MAQPGAKLSEFPGGTAMDASEILYTPCDVLIPAAIGGVITEENASRLQVCGHHAASAAHHHRLY